MPGITRRRAGKAFSYRGPDGRPIKDRTDLARIKRLAVPPAWTDVWICPYPHGHLQATGVTPGGASNTATTRAGGGARCRQVRSDARVRQALPRIRARVAEDQARRGLPREKVLATIVRLLEVTLIRVGNQEYARDNHSYGLTTLRDRHVDFEGTRLIFEYRGKGGKRHRISLRDRRLARIVRSCQELPGQHLFQYLDEDGKRQEVDSADVNAYLQEITGEGIHGQGFPHLGRDRAGLAGAQRVRELRQPGGRQAQRHACDRAGRGPARQYGCGLPQELHPPGGGRVLSRRQPAGALEGAGQESLRSGLAGLRSEEAAVLALLQQRLTREVGERESSRPRELSGPELKATLRRAVDEESRAKSAAAS